MAATDPHSAVERFYLEEYKALRAEIISRLRDYDALERYAVGACAAIYAWIAKDSGGHVSKAVWWVPVLVSMLAGARALGILKRLEGFSDYIYKIEQRLKLPPELPGWETYRKGEHRLSSRMISTSAWSLWLLLNVVTVLVAVVAFFHRA